MHTYSQRTPDDHAERVKRVRDARRYADKHDRLTELAGDHTRKQAEEWLGFLELEEADDSSRLDMNLSAAERAAAELLRGELIYKRELRELRADMNKRADMSDGLALDETRFGGDGKAPDSAPEAVWFVDSHGTRLLCF